MTMTLDTKGMNCPLPILKAKKAIKGLAAGETLQVLSTDPGSVKDFEAFCLKSVFFVTAIQFIFFKFQP